jgi:signal transduction histidine kinase
MDEIVWAVNPLHDSIESLVNYLHKFAGDFLESAGVRCRFDVPLQLPAWQISSEVRHNVFLGFKGALTNTVKHASASEVRISMTVEPAGFSLVIQDDGRGFDPNMAEAADSPGRAHVINGNGLQNMRRRMAEVGGRFEIHTAPGKGTRVIFHLPVNQG